MGLIGISIINDSLTGDQYSRNGLYSFNIKCLCQTAFCILQCLLYKLYSIYMLYNLLYILYYYIDGRHGMDSSLSESLHSVTAIVRIRFYFLWWDIDWFPFTFVFHKRKILRGLYFELSSCTEPSRPDQTRIDTCAKCHGLKFSLNIEHSQPLIRESLVYLAINFVKKILLKQPIFLTDFWAL